MASTKNNEVMSSRPVGDEEGSVLLVRSVGAIRISLITLTAPRLSNFQE
ncbi:Hypothetical protein, putative [Bodo saltans]|uniref:Uncharacterized protein n=1 Tax=Bodo saltans TaxID=75058 RepID=A0A0S4JIQ3_BODSA|nr:Hypothetical protein, putative [Bodo saltans]|eukprot:CUG89947.1 Hypothetical protein, putative [Bodo saltans]